MYGQEDEAEEQRLHLVLGGHAVHLLCGGSKAGRLGRFEGHATGGR